MQQQQQKSEGHFLKKTCTCSITTTTIYFICYALWGPTRFGWLASFTTTTTTTAAAAAVEVGVFLLIFLELDLSSVSGWDSRPLQHVASHAIRQYGGTTQENVAITISSRDLATTQVQQRKKKMWKPKKNDLLRPQSTFHVIQKDEAKQTWPGNWREKNVVDGSNGPPSPCYIFIGLSFVTVNADV